MPRAGKGSPAGENSPQEIQFGPWRGPGYGLMSAKQSWFAICQRLAWQTRVILYLFERFGCCNGCKYDVAARDDVWAARKLR